MLPNVEPCPNLPAGVLSPEQNSYSPMGWTGLPIGFSHVPSLSIPPNPSVPSRPTVLWDGRDCQWDSHMSHPQVYPQIPVSRPILQSCGMDGTVYWILTCPILKYTPKSQCPVSSHSPVGWTGLSMGFSHVPSLSIPPNPSVPSRPAVLWDGRDCPWDSHMSHPQVYPQIPVSRPVLQSCGMDGTVHEILTSHPQVYLQIPVSRPVLQSCGMDGTVHWILTCPILKYTPKSQCPVPSYSPMGWMGLSMRFSRPILKYTSKSQCPVPSYSPVGWTGLSTGFSHVPSSSIYPQIPVSRPVLQSCGMDGTVHGILTSHPQVYLQIPVSRPVPQSCGMDGIVHGILICPMQFLEPDLSITMKALLFYCDNVML